ncbi:MAG: YdcF family protein [Cyanobacteria bacterium P01_A01_bin.45]
MFLYLSKLIPLFIYPLGLSCISLAIALFFLKKRPFVARISIIFALLVLLFSSNSWVALNLVKSLEWQYTNYKDLPTSEAIVVLGGATRSKFPPRPAVDLMEQGDRVIYAAQLYLQKKAPIIILSGGRVDWRGQGASESSDMKSILTSLGIPSEVILEEPDSLNTYQNAVNVKKILESNNISKVLLVTSAIHMPRSIQIFRKQKINVIPAPVDFLVSQGDLSEIIDTPKAVILNLLPTSRNIHFFTSAIKEYIGLLVYRLRGWL